jgi:hypothetical protein
VIVSHFQEVIVKRRLYIFIVLVVLSSVLPGQELNKLLKRSNTDQIMLALEPSIEMPTGKIRDQIKLPVLWLINNTFYLFISTCRSEKPDEKFQAFYGIPVSSAWGVTQHVEYIHHLGNITGRGPTSRDALVDLVKKLVANGFIDPGRLVEKLKSK